MRKGVPETAKRLKAVVESAAEDMAFMLMDPSKPKDRPWKVVPVGTLVERVLPLCEFARNCEANPDPALAASARRVLEFFLTDPVAGEEAQ